MFWGYNITQTAENYALSQNQIEDYVFLKSVVIGVCGIHFTSFRITYIGIVKVMENMMAAKLQRIDLFSCF